MKSLQEELRHLINSRSLENGSNTPDFILAGYLVGCLAAFDVAVQARSKWYGREHQKPGHGDGLADESEILIQPPGFDDGTYRHDIAQILSELPLDHPVNLLRDQINQIGNIGNRPDLRAWREKSIAQLYELEEEIVILRQYGNKDCTAQADAVLLEKRQKSARSINGPKEST